MKYWQEERWQTATKTNVPHLYLYTWIRACIWVSFILNSIIVLLITKKGSALDNEIHYKPFCVIMIILALGMLFTVDSPRKVDRTVKHVVIDLLEVGLISVFYASYYVFMILLYIVEIGVIICFGIKIDKDNRLVDNNKIVIWWKHKERERSERQLQRFLAKHKVEEAEKVELTEEQKLKKMSRKQRKQYKQKKNK